MTDRDNASEKHDYEFRSPIFRKLSVKVDNATFAAFLCKAKLDGFKQKENEDKANIEATMQYIVHAYCEGRMVEGEIDARQL